MSSKRGGHIRLTEGLKIIGIAIYEQSITKLGLYRCNTLDAKPRTRMVHPSRLHDEWHSERGRNPRRCGTSDRDLPLNPQMHPLLPLPRTPSVCFPSAKLHVCLSAEGRIQMSSPHLLSSSKWSTRPFSVPFSAAAHAGHDKHNCLAHSHRASSDRDYLKLQGYRHAHDPSLSQSEPERTTWKYIVDSPRLSWYPDRRQCSFQSSALISPPHPQRIIICSAFPTSNRPWSRASLARLRR